MADGESLRLTRVGNVSLEVLARGIKMNVTLTEVYLTPRLSKNIVSYGKLASKGLASYTTSTSALARRSDGIVVLDVAIDSQVLYVETTATRGRHSVEDACMDADANGEHKASLLHWH